MILKLACKSLCAQLSQTPTLWTGLNVFLNVCSAVAADLLAEQYLSGAPISGFVNRGSTYGTYHELTETMAAMAITTTTAVATAASRTTISLRQPTTCTTSAAVASRSSQTSRPQSGTSYTRRTVLHTAFRRL